MRSKNSQHTISVIKRVPLGQIPLFVQLAHKGLQKSIPEPKETFGSSSTYVVPTDILRLSVSNPELIEDIEAIEFIYGT